MPDHRQQSCGHRLRGCRLKGTGRRSQKVRRELRVVVEQQQPRQAQIGCQPHRLGVRSCRSTVVRVVHIGTPRNFICWHCSRERRVVVYQEMFKPWPDVTPSIIEQRAQHRPSLDFVKGALVHNDDCQDADARRRNWRCAVGSHSAKLKERLITRPLANALESSASRGQRQRPMR